ncbi:hypothetical protein VP01_986g4 [Puccinia sorghi]|uniref:Uncharacterized protein n=1 Tax=Puccinia sorghi TaxID=27349 RepID=A0A0L6U5J7_9BASI|nr:hypothetical protein VP01_986g4 [Puccinia sorghi]
MPIPLQIPNSNSAQSMTSLPTSIHASANPSTQAKIPHNQSMPTIIPTKQVRPQGIIVEKKLNISIKFQLFAPTKSQQKKMLAKKKLWVETTSFEEFQSLVISAFNGHFTSAGSVIKKGLKARPQQIFWYETIPCCGWLDAACKAGQREIDLNLKMENPAKVAKYKLNANEWDKFNIHMKKLYAEHLFNVKYDCHTSVFIDQSNPNQYVLLTTNVCSEWSKALVDRKDGVLLKSPPTLLPFITATGAKRAHISNNNVLSSKVKVLFSSSHMELLADLIAAKKNATHTSGDHHTQHEGPLSSPPYKAKIESYLDCLGIRDKDHTLEILLENGFHWHKDSNPLVSRARTSRTLA